APFRPPSPGGIVHKPRQIQEPRFSLRAIAKSLFYLATRAGPMRRELGPPTQLHVPYSRFESFRSFATCSIRCAASLSEAATCSAQSEAGVKGAFSRTSS